MNKKQTESLKTLDELRYPTGKFLMPETFKKKDIKEWIKTIEKFPSLLKKETQNLSDKKQSWVYRPDGWSIRQVVHHCADSHMNAFIRFKLSMTEENPVIKPYKENLWAEMEDVKSVPVEWSVKMITLLHKRWTILLHSLTESDFERTYFHPESNRQWKLYEVVALYSWHCMHHLGHIKQAKKYKGKPFVN